MAKLSPILLHLLCVSCGLVTLGGSLQIYQPAEIKAEIGHPVTLSCMFNQSDDNTGRIFVVFTTTQHGDKNDIGGDLSKTCRQLASEQQLFLCEYSLSVRAVRLEDEGVYYCKATILPPNTAGIFRSTSGGTKLSLYAEASSVKIEQPRPLVSGHEATLTCTASGFYPQNASVLWSHRGDQVPPSSVITETKKSNDGTFQLHSEYRFSPTATDHGTESSCTVSHPDWSDGRTDSISLSVSYGPSSATVTSHSAAVTRGSVRVEMGSNLSLTCVGDGNPKPDTAWLRENKSEAHSGETLHITYVQKEHGGLYWCVVKNQYGEKNTSVHLLLLKSSETDFSIEIIYGLVAILGAVVMAIMFACWRRKKRKAAQGSGDHHPHSHVRYTDSLVPSEEAVYATPSKRWKKTDKLKPAQQTVDELQLIYADIIVPNASSNLIAKNDSTVSIYSDVGIKRGQQTVEKQNNEGMHSVYALAGPPV